MATTRPIGKDGTEKSQACYQKSETYGISCKYSLVEHQCTWNVLNISVANFLFSLPCWPANVLLFLLFIF